MGRRSKKKFITEIAQAGINLGENLNIKFTAFMDMVDAQKLDKLLKVKALPAKYDVMDIIAFTAHLAARVRYIDKDFIKVLKEFGYDDTLNQIILASYPLTKGANSGLQSVSHKEDVNLDIHASDTFVGELDSEKMKVTETMDDKILKYYGQDKASLEIMFSTSALGTANDFKKGTASRMDMMASMNLVTPKQGRVLALQAMLELAVQLVSQGLVTYLKQSDAFKQNPQKVKSDFEDYIMLLAESIMTKTEDLFEKDFKFITYDTKDDVV